MDPLHVCGNAANLDDRTIIFLHENRSQFPEKKMYFVLSSRLAASRDVQGTTRDAFELLSKLSPDPVATIIKNKDGGLMPKNVALLT